MARPVTAARRYAEAAFELAQRDDALDRWAADLQAAADVVALPEVEQTLGNPAIPLVERRAGLDRVLDGRVQAPVRKLAGLLLERARLSLLPRVAAEYRRLLNTHRGIVTAIVTSAAPLTDEETAAVRARVEQMAGARVELQAQVDPDLLGGLTVQVGDRFLDASVRGRLERLRGELLAGTRAR